MKRILALLLALLLLSACAAPAETTPESSDQAGDVQQDPGTPEDVQQEDDGAENGQSEPQPEPLEPQEGQFVFTRENFPRLDGSTSTVPLAEAMAAVLLSESVEQVQDLVQFSRTTESYRRLIAGDCDLLIAAEPAQSIWDEKEQAGFAWTMEPFAIDGLIFVVSADNPVDSLTAEQVRDIYAGKITNWSEVGGEDVAIAPFQRNAEAGSQTMMLKLVMGDTPIMDPPAEYEVDSMYGLMEAVKNYDGSTGAIGYSVYYYANDMRMAEGLKILKIEDVEPEPATFRDGSYPFTNPYYLVMAEATAEDSPTRILFDWVLSDEGQRLVNEMGYAAVTQTEAQS